MEISEGSGIDGLGDVKTGGGVVGSSGRLDVALCETGN